MTDEEFKQFMHDQCEHFRNAHGDCKDLTPEQIEEDSLEFRRRWSNLHPQDKDDHDLTDK